MQNIRRSCFVLLLLCIVSAAQEVHDHGVPQKLGRVSFPVSCAADVQEEFNRGVALLHSFAYSAAANSFAEVAKEDPGCAMAHWGIAMSYFRQLWEPPVLPATISSGQSEMKKAQQMGTSSKRERQYINALALIYEDPASPYSERALSYERAMRDLAVANKSDVEAQVWYALALLANASPSDKTHAKQKQAAEVLEPLYKSYPQHPGIPHYLIHAYDNAELATNGLAAAKAYSQIAPSAPHALHMPSHIYTRLGLWSDSIHSNLAAKDAARQHGDIGEELHAMDYLVYAYLQTGEDDKAAQVIGQLKDDPEVKGGDFKASYAATAMPVRYAVERNRWEDAAAIGIPPGAPPQVAAVAVWARGLGLVRMGRPAEAQAEIDRLGQIEEQLRAAGADYWATQTAILKREVSAWAAQAQKKTADAVTLMQSAADEEDAIEKLPVTPGPIVPAREQLGYLLLEQDQASLALKQFRVALANAPGRRGALQGSSQAQELLAKQ